MCPAAAVVVMVAIATVVTVQKRIRIVAKEAAANPQAKEIHRHRQKVHRRSYVNKNIQNHHGIIAKIQHQAIMIWLAVQHKHQVKIYFDKCVKKKIFHFDLIENFFYKIY